MLTTDCPTLPISAGSSRFCRRSPASRLDRRRDNSDPACPQVLRHCYLIVQYRHTAYECPAIGVLECTCGTMAAIMNYNGRGDVSSARANPALGAIIVDNTVLLYYLYECYAYVHVRTRTCTYVYLYAVLAR